jgi:hypothetical protein
MAEAKLILKKHARGDYEIGIQTEDGAVVARVCIWDGTAIDTRSETEREEAALEKAARRMLQRSGWMRPTWPRADGQQ